MNILFVTFILYIILPMMPISTSSVDNSVVSLDYKVELITIHRIQDKQFLDTGFIWTQARAAYLLLRTPYGIMTMSQKYSQGDDVYLDLYESLSYDTGKTWSKPRVIPSLKIHEVDDGYRRSMSDMTPSWHRSTRKVLNIGKSFFYTDNSTPDRFRREVAYTVFDPVKATWSEYLEVNLPTLDHEQMIMSAPVSGCGQWLEMNDGDVLIPISYRKMTQAQVEGAKREDYDVGNNMNSNENGTSVTVVKCSFDGEKLTYQSHGNEMSLKEGRGLGEPSITKYQGMYFLTIRQDKSAFVSKSKDGLQYEPIREWRFDDGEILGSYNTQQHWVTHSEGFFLVYTRSGANNDNVFRHRAPLFMAEVNPETLQVIRATERILIPNGGIALGNFGVTDVSQSESWVITTEYYRGEKDSIDNEVFVAKILWNTPNKLVENP